MAQQTTSMKIYQDIVLECQNCYMICRYRDAEARRNCPSCGRPIANWQGLAEALSQHPQPAEDTAIKP